MPLARIITDVADDCLELTMQLRARGYQVETVSPSAIPSTPADLEVRLEECAPEDVVIHASNGVSAEDLWVYVAPGALDANALPIRTIPISTGENPSTSSKILSITAKQKTERPPVVGSLAIDSHEEDPILAELHGFPMGQVSVAPAEQLSAILVAIPDLVRPSAPLVAKAPELVENKRPEKPSPKKPSIEAPPVKWLVDPEKKTIDSSPGFSIPIAPERVRAKISLPTQRLRRPAKRKVRWNFQPLQVACGLAMLALLGWTLMLIGRPQAVVTQRAIPAPFSASKPIPVPTQPAKTSVAQSAPQEKVRKPTPARAASAVAAARSMPASHRDATAGGTKTPKVHHDDGLIAADTVIFYDGRRPGPPRAKAQSVPSVKRYSDQN